MLQDIDPEFVDGMILPPVRARLEDRSVDVDNDNFDADDDPPVDLLLHHRLYSQPVIHCLTLHRKLYIIQR